MHDIVNYRSNWCAQVKWEEFKHLCFTEHRLIYVYLSRLLHIPHYVFKFMAIINNGCVHPYISLPLSREVIIVVENTYWIWVLSIHSLLSKSRYSVRCLNYQFGKEVDELGFIDRCNRFSIVIVQTKEISICNLRSGRWV